MISNLISLILFWTIHFFRDNRFIINWACYTLREWLSCYCCSSPIASDKYYKVLLTSECRIQSGPRTRTGLQMVKWQCMDCVRCAAALCLVLIICRLVIETQPWLLLKHREVIRPVQIYSEITGAASGKNASFNYPGFFLAWAGGGGSSSEQDRDM